MRPKVQATQSVALAPTAAQKADWSAVSGDGKTVAYGRSILYNVTVDVSKDGTARPKKLSHLQATSDYRCSTRWSRWLATEE